MKILNPDKQNLHIAPNGANFFLDSETINILLLAEQKSLSTDSYNHFTPNGAKKLQRSLMFIADYSMNPICSSGALCNHYENPKPGQPEDTAHREAIPE